jgi:beta-lactam-binding protein with PASTA domain
MTLAEANLVAESAGLVKINGADVVQCVQFVSSDTVPAGVIISQSPSAGSNDLVATRIDCVVSSGLEL